MSACPIFWKNDAAVKPWRVTLFVRVSYEPHAPRCARFDLSIRNLKSAIHTGGEREFLSPQSFQPLLPTTPRGSTKVEFSGGINEWIFAPAGSDIERSDG
jgi:hypothetical protein